MKIILPVLAGWALVKQFHGCGITVAGRFRAGFGDRLTGRQQRAAQRQTCLPLAVGQESKVADVDKARRQHVEQKAADELDRFQRHRLGLVGVGIVLPFESDPTIRQR